VDFQWCLYKPSQLDEIPELPGLYAWYLNFENSYEKIDPAMFLKLAERLATRMETHATSNDDDQKGHAYVADLEGTGSFGDGYFARLRVNRHRVGFDSDDGQDSTVLHGGEGADKILRKLFNESFLVFAAPIYVGKSKNLRDRIGTHLTNLRDAKKTVRKKGEHWYVENDDLGNFARRLVEHGLTESDLYLACVAIDPKTFAVTNQEAMHWITKVEYYFNNITRPVLGRR